MKRVKVHPGDHVLFVDSGLEPVVTDGVAASFIKGTHVFARGVCSYPVFEYNGYHIGFDHDALRDMVFILPTEPPEMMGEKQIIHCVDKHRKKHQDKTGLLLSAGPGYLNEKDGVFRPMDDRLQPGCIVKFDLTVPWRTFVRDTEGNKHYVCICGSTDIHGLWDKIEPAYINGADGG